MEQKKHRVLLAEDDENLGSLLREYLQAKSFETHWVTNGEKAYNHFKEHPCDLLILDIMMPVMDGFTVARDIRMINRDIPIIFLTAKSMKEDVLRGFTLGGDDYITKPFNMEELLMRIEAVLRRSKNNHNASNQRIYSIGEYTFDTRKQLLIRDGDEHKLTTKETELLKLLCNNSNNLLERDYALRTIWSNDSYFNARSMDVYITRLRKYLEKDPSVRILNIHGKGFKLIV